MALTSRHDKEGFCELNAQDMPLLSECTHKYALVFTKVGPIVYIALFKKDEIPSVSKICTKGQVLLISFEFLITDISG